MFAFVALCAQKRKAEPFRARPSDRRGKQPRSSGVRRGAVCQAVGVTVAVQAGVFEAAFPAGLAAAFFAATGFASTFRPVKRPQAGFSGAGDGVSSFSLAGESSSE